MVSIIVPSYNQGEYLPQTLDSILSQTYGDWECIIVNDGSSDNTEAVANQYCSKDSRFLYLNQVNSGVSIARNNGIKMSTGDYILPLDADDIIDPTYVEKAVAVLSNRPDIKLVYCRADKFGAEKGEWYLPEYSFTDLLWHNLLFCSSFFRRSDFDLTEGYNPNMACGCEDWDFWLSFLSPEDKVYKIDEILFHYRVKQVSRTTESLLRKDLVYRQIVRNHLAYYDPYIDGIIKMHNDLYWERLKAKSYYSKSLSRFKDIVLSMFRGI